MTKWRLGVGGGWRHLDGGAGAGGGGQLVVDLLALVAKVEVDSWWSKAIAVTGPEWKETTETKEADPFLFTLHTLGSGE